MPSEEKTLVIEDPSCFWCGATDHEDDDCTVGDGDDNNDMDDPDYDPIRDIDGHGFADPGGNSALRAATFGTCPRCRKNIESIDDYCRHCGGQLNPRKFPCPTCERPNKLTRLDVEHHYQCDACADDLERGY